MTHNRETAIPIDDETNFVGDPLQPPISQMRCHRRDLDFLGFKEEVTGLIDDFLRMQPKTSECQELEDRLVMPDGLDKAWYRILDFVEK